MLKRLNLVTDSIAILIICVRKYHLLFLNESNEIVYL